MKGFVLVSLFFVVFAGVIGGMLFLVGFAIKSLHLSEDAEHIAMAVGALLALVVGGWLMKQLHGIIQRRM